MGFGQAEYELRCEWGLQGMLHLAATSDAVIVVDILSFSTAADIVVANGGFVLPYRWKDESAAEFAKTQNAQLASSRSQSSYSLSPASLLGVPSGTALVLPSPNGSTICLSAGGATTYAGCLRNATAIAAHLRQSARRVAVIPAGERWPDESLRPCLEDWIGAGAMLSMLPGSRSPEAELAVAAFERFGDDLPGAFTRCTSGQELVERGFQSDIELAAEYAVSSAVPVLVGDRFVNAALRS